MLVSRSINYVCRNQHCFFLLGVRFGKFYFFTYLSLTEAFFRNTSLIMSNQRIGSINNILRTAIISL